VIYVGTCGYAYRDWVGPFYPKGLQRITPAEYLSFYASRFSAVEIDSSYYHVPKWANVHAMNRKTPPEFRFSFKAPATVTHPPEVRSRVHDDAKLLADRLSSLRSSGKLVCILAQFPNSFGATETNEEYVRNTVTAFDGIPVVVEFRHRGWQTPRTIAFVRDIGAGYCNVDMPSYPTLLAPSEDATSGIGYVRLHGRNAQTWWTGTNVTRYDYEYGEEELVPWSDRIADLEAQTQQTMVFFNNHARGQAPKNAAMLVKLLSERYGERAEGLLMRPPAPLTLL
jgi:uncharacterized protein YecE (DUF72 family)